jgi:hypothetical protein
MSRHRGAKPDRRYGLLDPIHMFPHFHGVQTISSSHTKYGRLACYLGHIFILPARQNTNQSRAGRNPCTQEIVATSFQTWHSRYRRKTCRYSDRISHPRYCPLPSKTCVFARPQRVCFQQWNVGFHRSKPSFLSCAITRTGAYF